MRKQYATRADYDEDQRHQLPPRVLDGHKIQAMMVEGTHPYGMRYHYVRPWVSILEALNIPAGATRLFVGTGFGWEAEIANELGFTAVGVETSSYVHSVKDADYTTEYRERIISEGLDPDSGAGAALLAEWDVNGRTQSIILNEMMNTAQSRKAVRNALGLSGNTKVDWAISANVLPVLDDSEVVDMNTAMQLVADNVAHYTPILSTVGTQRPDFNWKTLMGWKALLTPSIIIRTVRPTNKPAWDRLTTEMV